MRRTSIGFWLPNTSAAVDGDATERVLRLTAGVFTARNGRPSALGVSGGAPRPPDGRTYTAAHARSLEHRCGRYCCSRRPRSHRYTPSPGAVVRPGDSQRPHRRRHRQPVVSGRHRHQGRHHRRGSRRAITTPAARMIDVGGQGRRAGLHRHSHARAARHLRDADRRQLRAAGRDDDHRRAGRQSSPLPLEPFLAKWPRSEVRRTSASFIGQGSIPIQGDRARRTGRRPGQRSRRCAASCEQGMEDGAFGLSSGSVLRARHVHADRGGRRAGEGRRPHGRHLHLAHARRSVQACSTACARRSRSASRAACRRR